MLPLNGHNQLCFRGVSTVPRRAADGVHCIRMLSSVSLFFFSTAKVTRAVNIIYNSFAIRLFFCLLRVFPAVSVNSAGAFCSLSLSCVLFLTVVFFSASTSFIRAELCRSCFHRLRCCVCCRETRLSGIPGSLGNLVNQL